MKKFDIFKTIQLIIFVLLTGIALYIIFTDHELYQLKSAYPGAVYLIMGSVRHLFPLYFP